MSNTIPHWKNKSLETLQEYFEGELYIEEWKDIIGYEGYYQVSSFGRIKSMDRIIEHASVGKQTLKSKIRSQTLNTCRYPCMNFNKNDKIRNIVIHRLVALHFIANPDSLPEVNHKKGIKTDNRFHQLEWITSGGNKQHAFDIGLRYGYSGVANPMYGKLGDKCASSKPVAQYTEEGQLIAVFSAGREAERKTGIKQQSISKACRGIMKTAGGFKWKYHEK